eukprot:363348-Chlamydomonas_euryale.AAC.19
MAPSQSTQRLTAALLPCCIQQHRTIFDSWAGFPPSSVCNTEVQSEFSACCIRLASPITLKITPNHSCAFLHWAELVQCPHGLVSCSCAVRRLAYR